jgi:hypothetical protein
MRPSMPGCPHRLPVIAAACGGSRSCPKFPLDIRLGLAQLDTIPQIRLFAKLKLKKCAPVPGPPSQSSSGLMSSSRHVFDLLSLVGDVGNGVGF